MGPVSGEGGGVGGGTGGGEECSPAMRADAGAGAGAGLARARGLWSAGFALGPLGGCKHKCLPFFSQTFFAHFSHMYTLRLSTITVVPAWQRISYGVSDPSLNPRYRCGPCLKPSVFFTFSLESFYYVEGQPKIGLRVDYDGLISSRLLFVCCTSFSSAGRSDCDAAGVPESRRARPGHHWSCSRERVTLISQSGRPKHTRKKRRSIFPLATSLTMLREASPAAAAPAASAAAAASQQSQEDSVKEQLRRLNEVYRWDRLQRSEPSPSSPARARRNPATNGSVTIRSSRRRRRRMGVDALPGYGENLQLLWSAQDASGETQDGLPTKRCVQPENGLYRRSATAWRAHC